MASAHDATFIEQMKTKPFKVLLLSVLVASLSVADEVPVQLSPEEKEKLRSQRLVPGLPMPPNITNAYRVTASLTTDQMHTQTLALVTVTVITKAKTALVRSEDGKFRPYLSTDRPVVVSVKTNRYDILRAPEVP